MTPLLPEVNGYLFVTAKDVCPLGASDSESVAIVVPFASRILRDRFAGVEPDWLASATPVVKPVLSYGTNKAEAVEVVKGEVPWELVTESWY